VSWHQLDYRVPGRPFGSVNLHGERSRLLILAQQRLSSAIPLLDPQHCTSEKPLNVVQRSSKFSQKFVFTSTLWCGRDRRTLI
jgi:hypothetical protein